MGVIIEKGQRVSFTNSYLDNLMVLSFSSYLRDSFQILENVHIIVSMYAASELLRAYRTFCELFYCMTE